MGTGNFEYTSRAKSTAGRFGEQGHPQWELLIQILMALDGGLLFCRLRSWLVV